MFLASFTKRQLPDVLQMQKTHRATSRTNMVRHDVPSSWCARSKSAGHWMDVGKQLMYETAWILHWAFDKNGEKQLGNTSIVDDVRIAQQASTESWPPIFSAKSILDHPVIWPMLGSHDAKNTIARRSGYAHIFFKLTRQISLLNHVNYLSSV